MTIPPLASEKDRDSRCIYRTQAWKVGGFGSTQPLLFFWPASVLFVCIFPLVGVVLPHDVNASTEVYLILNWELWGINRAKVRGK